MFNLDRFFTVSLSLICFLSTNSQSRDSMCTLKFASISLTLDTPGFCPVLRRFDQQRTLEAFSSFSSSSKKRRALPSDCVACLIPLIAFFLYLISANLANLKTELHYMVKSAQTIFPLPYRITICIECVCLLGPPVSADWELSGSANRSR